MKWLKIVVVAFVAVVITTLGIDAADTLTGKSGTMLGQLISSENGICPKGMVEVPTALSFTCIDAFEATAAKSCDIENPNSNQDTQDNINNLECSADSRPDALPWRFINREQASIMCARAGKRLPTADEWYKSSLGSLDTNDLCNIDSNSAKQSGENEDCISAYGVYDMVGNVWEWVADDVIDGNYNGRVLPEEGYVSQVDAAGVATITNKSPQEIFSKDYFWTSKSGAYGILRGGYYGSDEDAGIYSFHAKTSPTSATVAIGFRCVI